MPFLDPSSPVGAYRVLRLVASSGAAEVYEVERREDGQKAALKLFVADQQDADRRRRFLEEARVYSRLIHPRVVKLYEAGEWEDRPYLVTEWVPGSTLEEKIGLSPPAPPAALDILLQVADGLSAAHGLGLIHRDLKPSNIMLTEEGAVKLLDFGLAKPLPVAELPRRSWTTVHGIILGTPAYMSPEQARGEPLTLASDLFSFGAVMFELLSGSPAFQRDTAAETLGAILKDSPPPLPRLPGLPQERVAALLTACLEKDPSRRPADGRELLVELRRLRTPAPSFAASPRPRLGARAWTGGLLACAALVLAGFSLRAVFHQAPAPPALEGLRPVPVEGNSPCITPDGREILFRSEDGREIWGAPLAEGNQQLVFASKSQVDNFSIAADGQALLFDTTGPDGARWIHEVPTIGGAPRRITRGWSGTCSPDGLLVAALSRPADSPYEVVVCRRDGTDRRVLRHLPEGLTPRSLCFHASGESLFVSLTDGLRHSEIVAIDLDNGTLKRVAGVNGVAAEGLALLPGGQGLLWSVQLQSDGTNLLGISSLEDGQFRLLFPGPARTTHPSLTADGRFLVVQIREATSELLEVAVDPRAASAAAQTRLFPHTKDASQPRVSPDGKRLVYRSGRRDLWLLDRETGAAGPLLATGEGTFNPAWSADGRLLAYSCLRDGQADLWLATADGADPRPLTSDTANDVHPVWHRDGRHLFFVSDKAGSDELYRIDVATHETVRVGNEGALNPALSPDGRHIAFIVPAGSQPGRLRLARLTADLRLGETLWEIPADGSSWAGYKPRFSPDGRWVAFDAPVDPAGADIWALPVEKAAVPRPVRLTALPFAASLLSWFDWGPDGHLVVTASHTTHRVFLLQGADRWFQRALP